MSDEASGRLDMLGLERAKRALDVLFAQVQVEGDRYVDSFVDGMAPFHEVVVSSPYRGEGFVASSTGIAWSRR